MTNWQIIEGDCIEQMAQLPNASIDLVLTDPPYGTTQCKWDAIVAFEPMWRELRRVTKLNAAILLFSSQPFTSALVMSNPRMFKHEWIWIKNRGSNFANTVREPMKEHEAIVMFSNGGWTYNKQMQERTGAGAARVEYDFNHRTKTENYGSFVGLEGQQLPQMRVPSSWQKFNTEVGLHPQQKPIDLLRYLIRTYSNEGDIVLDFTCDSGSTGVACLLENRNFIGIEQEAKYVAIARQRLNDTRLSEPPPATLFDHEDQPPCTT